MLSLTGYLKAEQPGYRGLLTSAQLAHLCQEVNTQLCPDCKSLQAWMLSAYEVTYSVAGLTTAVFRLVYTF